jgi:trans-aconitate 2-methyltransferase
MQSPPITQAEIEARISSHLDELLALWHAEQGTSKTRDLELLASVIPFSRDRPVRVLDLCCGPGDVGRALHRMYRAAQVDCVDRDPFLAAICKGINQRDRVPGKIVVRDLHDGWPEELAGSYDVAAMVNSLHWFDATSAAQLLTHVHESLCSGGIFLLAEPARSEQPFTTGFTEWSATQPQRYSEESWKRFWFRANDILGYNHIKLLGSRDDDRIGDSLSVRDWISMVTAAGFKSVDVLLRDADQVIIAAINST